jgi:hypothetical protein
MLVKKKNHMYSNQRKFVHGAGFFDSLTSGLRGIGSYISQNRDLIAKPLLGAVGNIGALALTEGGKALISRIAKQTTTSKKLDADSNKILESLTKPSATQIPVSKLDPDSIKLLQNIVQTLPASVAPTNAVSNIIGSGIKKF